MATPNNPDNAQEVSVDIVKQTEALNLSINDLDEASQSAHSREMAHDAFTEPSSAPPTTADDPLEDQLDPIDQTEHSRHPQRAPPASRPWFEDHDEDLARFTERVLDETESDFESRYRLRRRTKRSHSKTFNTNCAKGDIWFMITQRPQHGAVMTLEFVCEGKPPIAYEFPLNAVHGVDLANNDLFEQFGTVLERFFNAYDCDQPHAACLWRLADWALPYLGGRFSLMQTPEWTDKQCWLVRIHYTNYLTEKIETFNYSVCKGMTFARSHPLIPAQRVFHKGSYQNHSYIKSRVADGKAIWPSALPKDAIRPTDPSGKTYSESSLKNTEYFMRYLVHYLSHTKSSHEQMMHTIAHIEGRFTGHRPPKAKIAHSHFTTACSLFALVGFDENRRTRVRVSARYRDALYLAPGDDDLYIHELQGHLLKFRRLLPHLQSVYLRRFDGRETMQELDRGIEKYKEAKRRKQAEADLSEDDQAAEDDAEHASEGADSPEAVIVITTTAGDSHSLSLQEQ